MKQSFIISIFLLILCIIISQVAGYYLQENIVEGVTVTTPTPQPPAFIQKYIDNIEKNNYLSKIQITDIYTASNNAMQIEKVTDINKLKVYLGTLSTNLSTSNSPRIPQIVFFCISIPRAFELFYTPCPSIPIPYNMLHARMSDIFPTSVPYTQIQTICVLWQQCSLLLSPKGNIIDPRDDIFNDIINTYISQIKRAINILNAYYDSRLKNI